MEWYQVSYCLAGREVWHMDGGILNPRKFYQYSKAQEREKELCKRYPGVSTLITRVTQVQFSNLLDKQEYTTTSYVGMLN